MIFKILNFPRAVADIIKVLLHKNISFADRWEIAKVLGKIKIASLTKKLNDPLLFRLGKWKINCFYNRHIGFLIKEIFLEQVYAVKKTEEVYKILDLGSNIGLSIAYFKMHFPNTAIDAYEPEKSSFELLQKNISENYWKNVFANEIAISDENGFLFTEYLEEKASINTNFTLVGKDESNKVAARDITEILNENFDVIKMDIEGGEWRLFKKIMDQQLVTKANHWFVEFHELEKNRTLFKEIIECFKTNGYSTMRRKEVFYFSKNI